MHEVELVRLTDKPVLGIGLGFELICYAFGCQLHEESERAAGAISVRPTGDGSKVFQGTDPIKASETQRWAVDDVPRELVVLARSDNGIEAVRHKTRQIFGLQLQPEDFVYASDGKMVFENILDAFRKK
jgi:anthranilate/para-aminobenzoate synthase component II